MSEHGADRKESTLFFEPDERNRTQRALDHVRGPWSRQRAWGLVCASLAAVPGVRRYVLYTTLLKEHPLFDTHERAGAAMSSGREERTTKGTTMGSSTVCASCRVDEGECPDCGMVWTRVEEQRFGTRGTVIEVRVALEAPDA